MALKGESKVGKAKKDDWVQVFKVVLKPEERAPGLPSETAGVPLTMKVKGFLVDQSADVGDQVLIQTVTGRLVKGKLIEVAPTYKIDYGYPQPELLKIGLEVKSLLREEGESSEK